MSHALALHEDRLFSSDPTERAIARRLYAEIRSLPIISPHGHTDPRWFAEDRAFSDPSTLLIIPDHYVFRMLYSQGVPLEALGVQREDGVVVEKDPRAIWRRFAKHWYLFRGTPTRLWLHHTLHELFGVREELGTESADRIYDQIQSCLARPEYRPGPSSNGSGSRCCRPPSLRWTRCPTTRRCGPPASRGA